MPKKKEIKSGFNAPSVGVVHPKNTKIKKNKDGTIQLVKGRKK